MNSASGHLITTWSYSISWMIHPPFGLGLLRVKITCHLNPPQGSFVRPFTVVIVRLGFPPPPPAAGAASIPSFLQPTVEKSRKAAVIMLNKNVFFIFVSFYFLGLLLFFLASGLFGFRAGCKRI